MIHVYFFSECQTQCRQHYEATDSIRKTSHNIPCVPAKILSENDNGALRVHVQMNSRYKG